MNLSHLYRLQRRILLLATIGVMITGLVVGIVTLGHLHLQSRNYNENAMALQVHGQAQAMAQLLDRYCDVARQISSRSQIRDQLERYNSGTASLDSVRDFSVPRLVDALAYTPDLAGMLRLSRGGAVVASLGAVPLEELWQSWHFDPSRVQITGPYTWEDTLFVLASSPIVNRAGDVVGMDLVAFDTSGLSELMGAHEAFHDDDTFQYLLHRQGSLPTVLGQSSRLQVAAGVPAAVESISPSSTAQSFRLQEDAGRLVYIQPLPGQDQWVLVISMPVRSIHPPLFPQLATPLLAVLLMMSLGVLVTSSVMRPLFLRSSRWLQRFGRLNEELDRSHRRFTAILNSLDAAVYVADMQTHELLFVNEYIKRQLGDVTGQKCWQVLQGLQEPCAFCNNHRLLTEDGRSAGVVQWEFQNLWTQQWFDCRDNAIQWTDGRFVRMEVATDISERKRIELELQQTLAGMRSEIEAGIAKAREQDAIIAEQNRRESVTRLLVNLAHQWRQPLNVVGIMVQNTEEHIENGVIDKTQALADLRMAMDQLQEISSVITRLTRLYQSEAQANPLRVLEAFHFAAHSVRFDYRKRARIDTRISEELSFEAVESDLIEIFHELLSNALAAGFARDMSEVRIEVAAQPMSPDGLQIWCRDNAGGVDAQLLPVIFDPYTTSGFRGRGKGMGLYHIRRLVEERYGGSVSLQNEEDGVLVIVCLAKYRAHPRYGSV